jgi:hypothetical protein
MNIKFINHASVMFDLCEVRILTDPWYQGLVFNDGWSLLNSGQNIGNFFRQTQLYYMNNIGKYYPKSISNGDIINIRSFIFEVLNNASSC